MGNWQVIGSALRLCSIYPVKASRLCLLVYLIFGWLPARHITSLLPAELSSQSLWTFQAWDGAKGEMDQDCLCARARVCFSSMCACVLHDVFDLMCNRRIKTPKPRSPADKQTWMFIHEVIIHSVVIWLWMETQRFCSTLQLMYLCQHLEKYIKYATHYLFREFKKKDYL